jgi:DNA-binding MarR family transcriptional regulator
MRMDRQGPIRAHRSIAADFPMVDSTASDVVINLLQAHELLEDELGRFLRGFDLTLAGFRTLMLLRLAGAALEPAQIADRLSCSRATVTGVLDSLEKRELVERTPHRDDRRKITVRATQQGSDLLSQLLPGWFAVEIDAAGALDADEREQLVQLLWKFQQSLRGMHDKRCAKRTKPDSSAAHDGP